MGLFTKDKEELSLCDSFMITRSGSAVLQKRMGSGDIMTSILSSLETERRSLSGDELRTSLETAGMFVSATRMERALQRLCDSHLISNVSRNDSADDGDEDDFGTEID